MESTSRRGFLKLAGLGAAGAVLSSRPISASATHWGYGAMPSPFATAAS